MGLRYVLDTNVVLYFFDDKLAAPLPSSELYVSIVTEIELLSFKKLSAATERRIREFLAEVSVIGVDELVKEKAISLRRAHGLKLPDAIVAASAAV